MNNTSWKQLPVTLSRGLRLFDVTMIGVKPGRTVVHAEFDGVPTEKGLEVTVTEGLELDKIRLRPSPPFPF